jgi:L-ascorbate metabolism protein UlaG (beta-lactamase superfamily)
MDTSVTFRWLGVASVIISAGGETLAIDPFFSRPHYGQFLLGRPTPDRRLAEELVPYCDYVLISHSHWDHIMDVPNVVRNTGATAFGSPNSCRLLELLGTPTDQIRLIKAGDQLTLGPFKVEILPAPHGFVPLMAPGPVASDLRLPLRVRDYRMDSCFGFYVQVGGYRLLLQTNKTRPADLLFQVPARHGQTYYSKLLHRVQPAVVIPIHWDDLFRPLSKPLREHIWPTTMGLTQIKRLVEECAPGTLVIKPQVFHVYHLHELLEHHRHLAATGAAPVH